MNESFNSIHVRRIIIIVSFCFFLYCSKSLGSDLIDDGESAAFHRLMKCGFNPQAILDIGANVGDWSKKINKLFPSSYILMIEGNEDHQNSLLKTGFDFTISLIGDKEKEVKYYTTAHGDATGNSIFKENSKFYDKDRTTILKMQRLDDLLSKRKSNGGVSEFSLVKFDIQGSEVLAIKGGKITLAKAEVILTEASVMNYNAGAPTFLKLYRSLDALGFAIYDFPSGYRDENSFLTQMDVIWVRKSSPLWRMNCTGYPSWDWHSDMRGKIYKNKPNKLIND